MATKNYTVLALLFVLTAPASADSGPYFAVGVGLSHGSVERAAEVMATHPVDGVNVDHVKNGLGLALSAGYRWQSWYAEAGWAELGELSHDVFQFGEDASFTYLTSSERQDEAYTTALKFGRRFDLWQSASLYAELGAHRYTNKVTLSQSRTQTDKVLGTSAGTASESSFREHDNAVMYGIGIAHRISDGYDLQLGLSRFRGIDRTVFGMSFQFIF